MTHPSRPASRLKQSVAATSLALLAAHAAHARQAPPPTPEQRTEKVEVTGTRIPPPNLEGASPVTVIDAQTIKVDGVRSVENLLNNLPQVVADMGGNVSNGATGTATVNLRALGPNRTLVLMNGRRLPPGSPLNFASDLNQVPAPLIKRVEVLTGGAGAVYGSDAVAGVVNFIMNDRFEGAQFEVNQSFYNHQQDGGPVAELIRARAVSNSTQFKLPGDKSSDGKIFDMSMLLGGNFANGRGNGTVFFNYKKEDALLQSERDFSACSIGNATTGATSVINGITFGPGFRCGGSGTSFPGQFLVAAGARTVANAAGSTRAYVGANDQYNFGPTNFFQRPSERYGFNAFVNYDVMDNAKVYSEFSFHDDRTLAQIAPSGLFGFDASGANAIQCANPFLSADWRRDLGCSGATGTADALIFRRNVEGGGRLSDLRHTSFRSAIGVKGELAGVWNYDVSAQTGKVIYQQVFKNDFSNTRIGRALNAVRTASGDIACQSVIDGTDLNCVPYNIWSLGQVTPEALAYVQTPGFQKGFTEQKIQTATLSADLGHYGWRLPAAKNGFSVALGAEHRSERLELDTDTAFTTGDLAGQGGPTIGLGGAYTVREFFGEARLPLVEGGAFAHLLSLNGSYRRSDYNTGKKTDSYGVGVEWAPVSSVRTRASYQRAARAANVVELFTARGLGLFDMNEDPCGPSRAATLEQCARTGLTAAQYGTTLLDSPAGQYNQLAGGNPNLSPEKSDSFTFGLVFTPMKNLSATLDVFSIKVEEVIGTAPAGTTLNQCLATGSAAFCSLITRDRLGTLWALPTAQVVATNLNLGSFKTSGIDVGATWTTRLAGMGGLTMDFNGTFVKEFKQEPIPGLGTFDCVGLHGASCGVPQPEWRHKLRGTWATPWNVDVALTWRHFGKADHEGTSDDPLLAATVQAADRTLGERNYLDIAVSWAMSKHLSLRAGINNLMDKDPPLSGLVPTGFGNGNTYPQAYDALGRRVFVNLTASF